MGNGAGVETEGTLLTVWQKATIGAGLAQRGYDIVMAPAEAYYLDIAHSTAWSHWRAVTRIASSDKRTPIALR